MSPWELVFPLRTSIRRRTPPSWLRAGLTAAVTLLLVWPAQLAVGFWQFSWWHRRTNWRASYAEAWEMYLRVKGGLLGALSESWLLPLIVVAVIGQFLVAMIMPLLDRHTVLPRHRSFVSQVMLPATRLCLVTLQTWIILMPLFMAATLMGWRAAGRPLWAFVLGGAYLAFGGMMLEVIRLTTRAILQQTRLSHCRECGYQLAGLTQPRCPECGTPFDPAALGSLPGPPGSTVDEKGSEG